MEIDINIEKLLLENFELRKEMMIDLKDLISIMKKMVEDSIIV